jgi:hypothetical protein
VAELTYSYNIAGHHYTSTDLGFMRGNDEEIVRKLIESHPEGSTITVYYQRWRPSNALVVPGVGSIAWFLFGVSVFMLLIVIPLWMSKTNATATQARLAKKYRVYESPRQRMVSQFPPLVEWTMPLDAWKLAASKARHEAFWMAIRLVTIVSLVMILMQIWLAPVIDKHFPWMTAYAIVMGFSALAVIAKAWEAALAGRAKPPTYAITSEGIVVPSREHPLIRWNQLVSFTRSPDDLLPERNIITIYSKAGQRRVFALPPGTAQEDIQGHFEAHLRRGAPPANASPLRAMDWIVGVVLSFLTVFIGSGYLASQRGHHSGSELFDCIMLGGFVFGPGTWVALCMIRRRAKTQLFLLAMTLNLLCTFFTLLAVVVRSLK